MVHWVGDTDTLAGYQSVSLADLGVQRADFALGGRFNEVAPDGRAVASIIAGAAAESQSPTDTRVRGNWLLGGYREQAHPLAEIIGTRFNRSLYSVQAQSTDDVVGAALDVLAELPYNAGLDFAVKYPFDELPPWFDVSAVPDDELIDYAGNLRVRQLVVKAVTDDLHDLVERLDLIGHVIDLQTQAYVHGDGFTYRLDRVVDQTYRSDISRIHYDNGVAELQALNPSAVTLVPDKTGFIREVVLRGPGGIEPTVLDQDHLLRIKNLGTKFSTYGVPQAQRAFEDLQVKGHYLLAASAWGQRYALPVRMLKYGALVRAGNNAGVAATPEMKLAAETVIRQYDPSRGQTIVAPFHWDYSFVGAEGAVALAISSEVDSTNRRILGALGVPPAFITSDWTNYATARMQYMQLIHRLRGRQHQMSQVLQAVVIRRHLELRGYVDPNGDLIEVGLQWKRGYLADDQSMHDLLAELAGKKGVISLRTIREMLGYDNAHEEENLDEELEEQMRRQRALLQAMPPPPGTETEGDDAEKDDTAPPDDEPENDLVVARRLRAGLRRSRRQVTQAVEEGLRALRRAQSLPEAQRVVVRRVAARRVLQAQHIADAYARRLIARTQTHTASAAIMLRLPAEAAQHIAPLGTTPEGELHITLAYIPSLPYSPEALAALRAAVRAFCQAHQPIPVRTAGIGRFPAAPGEELQPVWLSVESTLLVAAQQALAALLASEFVLPDRPYRPHITLDYVAPDSPLTVASAPAIPQFACSQVWLSVRYGDIQLVDEEYPCGG